MSGNVFPNSGLGNAPGFAPRLGSWLDDSAVGAVHAERNRAAALVALLGSDPRIQRVIAAIKAGEQPEAVAEELAGGKKA